MRTPLSSCSHAYAYAPTTRLLAVAAAVSCAGALGAVLVGCGRSRQESRVSPNWD